MANSVATKKPLASTSRNTDAKPTVEDNSIWHCGTSRCEDRHVQRPATDRRCGWPDSREGDLRRLQECGIDKCGVQLSAEGIEQFVRTLDWRAADTTARATRGQPH